MATRIPIHSVSGVHRFALVDERDVEVVSAFRWHFKPVPSKRGVIEGYAQSWKYVEGKSRTVLMHRLILAPGPGLWVDHVNGDGLDNRRENIRVCTPAQNGKNRHGSFGASPFKGVVWNKKSGRWQAQIRADGTMRYLGLFTEERDAALAYNEAAVRWHGSFAQLNQVAE